MTLKDFVPLLLSLCVSIVSGAYLKFLITKDKDEDICEITTSEANKIEMKVPKSYFSVKSSESEKVLKEIQQKTNTEVILEEDTSESYVCRIEGSFEDRERAKTIICAVIANHVAGLSEEIEYSKQLRVLSERNEKNESAESNITKDAFGTNGTNDSIVTLPASKRIQVFVSSVVNPSQFWVQLIDSKATELDELEKEMNAFYAVPENCKLHALENVSVNDLVAAPFNEEDNFFRAQVVEVLNGKEGVELDLFYKDYGDDEKISIERAFSLNSEFLKLKFQAVQCSLANIQPRNGQWSDEAVDFFCAITEVAKWKDMEAEVVDVGKNGEPMLRLFDRQHGKLFDVADELVKHNHASYCCKPGFAVQKIEKNIIPGGEEEYDSDYELDFA